MNGDQASAFLDTSCIVRYLTGDPPAIAERAAEILDGDESLTLTEVVLAETAYVLESFYKTPREPLLDSLTALIQRRNIQLLSLDKPTALVALAKCRGSKRTSFADALLWALAFHQGAKRIYSFDRRFPSENLKIVGME